MKGDELVGIMIDSDNVLRKLELEYGVIFNWNDMYEDDYQFAIKRARDIVIEEMRETYSQNT